MESVGVNAETLRAAYAGRSVFVTGHTGFKGSWLALWLARLGACVHGFALHPPTEPSNFVVSGIEQALASHTLADIRDVQRLSATLAQAQPEIILHLAAQPIVRESYRAPRETFDVNVMGTLTLLEAVRSQGRPCAVIVVTSDKCYHNREQEQGYREDDALGGKDPYSASKGAAEIVTASHRASFFPSDRFASHGVQLATARAGNVIGGGDWAIDRILPDAVRALARGASVPVRNPASVRPWQHVLQPLSGYLALGAKMLAAPEPRWSAAWNFGPHAGDEQPVHALVEAFIQGWGGGQWEDRREPNAPPEARTLRLDISKARRELGWQPCWNMLAAATRAARWYRAYYDHPDAGMQASCLEEIAAYEHAMQAQEVSA